MSDTPTTDLAWHGPLFDDSGDICQFCGVHNDALYLDEIDLCRECSRDPNPDRPEYSVCGRCGDYEYSDDEGASTCCPACYAEGKGRWVVLHG